jgi:hypothetical protein
MDTLDLKENETTMRKEKGKRPRARGGGTCRTI